MELVKSTMIVNHQEFIFMLISLEYELNVHNNGVHGCMYSYQIT